MHQKDVFFSAVSCKKRHHFWCSYKIFSPYFVMTLLNSQHTHLIEQRVVIFKRGKVYGNKTSCLQQHFCIFNLNIHLKKKMLKIVIKSARNVLTKTVQLAQTIPNIKLCLHEKCPPHDFFKIDFACRLY